MSGKLSLSDIGSTYATGDNAKKQEEPAPAPAPAPPPVAQPIPVAAKVPQQHATAPPPASSAYGATTYQPMNVGTSEPPPSSTFGSASFGNSNEPFNLNNMATGFAIAGFTEKAKAMGAISAQYVPAGVEMPKLEMHKIRGPSAFCGLGVVTPYNLPPCDKILPRVQGNLAYFRYNCGSCYTVPALSISDSFPFFLSANYMLVVLLMSVCIALGDFMFLMSAAFCAYGWNQVLKLSVSNELTAIGPFTVGDGPRRAGMGFITLILFYLFGKGVVFRIMYYSAAIVFMHAFSRDFEQIEATASVGDGTPQPAQYSYQGQDTELNL
jgi:hypothetical protein